MSLQLSYVAYLYQLMPGRPIHRQIQEYHTTNEFISYAEDQSRYHTR